MNTKEHMIIIKGNVKTSEVRACRYNSDTETWEVEFTAGRFILTHIRMWFIYRIQNS